jgi:hypothetical protein
MAVYKLFPTKDATLYSLFPTMNTGLDPIIEATLTTFAFSDANPQTSRFLISFDETEIEDVLENKIGISSSAQLLSTSSWKATLNCFIATATGLEILPIGTTLECYPVSGAWSMGTGQYLDSPQTTDGTSWIWQGYSGSNTWATSSYGPSSTGSYNTTYAPAGGGTWYTGSVIPSRLNSNIYPITASQTFNYKSTKDTNFNVSNMIRAWYTGAIPNNTFDGFIIKQDPEFIDNINYQPELKYYSVDTNTIYPPQLQFSWRDFNFNTGSSTQTILNTLPATITVANNPGTFFPNSINKFRVNARPEFPIQIWQTSSVYINNYFLPTSSYYAIKDVYTNEYVIGFDDLYTQISADSTSSYFEVYMNGLEPERYYTILIKTIINGTTIVFDNQYSFKVVNG